MRTSLGQSMLSSAERLLLPHVQGQGLGRVPVLCRNLLPGAAPCPTPGFSVLKVFSDFSIKSSSRKRAVKPAALLFKQVTAAPSGEESCVQWVLP